MPGSVAPRRESVAEVTPLPEITHITVDSVLKEEESPVRSKSSSFANFPDLSGFRWGKGFELDSLGVAGEAIKGVGDFVGRSVNQLDVPECRSLLETATSWFSPSQRSTTGRRHRRSQRHRCSTSASAFPKDAALVATADFGGEEFLTSACPLGIFELYGEGYQLIDDAFHSGCCGALRFRVLPADLLKVATASSSQSRQSYCISFYEYYVESSSHCILCVCRSEVREDCLDEVAVATFGHCGHDFAMVAALVGKGANEKIFRAPLVRGWVQHCFVFSESRVRWYVEGQLCYEAFRGLVLAPGDSLLFGNVANLSRGGSRGMRMRNVVVRIVADAKADAKVEAELAAEALRSHQPKVVRCSRVSLIGEPEVNPRYQTKEDESCQRACGLSSRISVDKDWLWPERSFPSRRLELRAKPELQLLQPSDQCLAADGRLRVSATAAPLKGIEPLASEDYAGKDSLSCTSSGFLSEQNELPVVNISSSVPVSGNLQRPDSLRSETPNRLDGLGTCTGNGGLGLMRKRTVTFGEPEVYDISSLESSDGMESRESRQRGVSNSEHSAWLIPPGKPAVGEESAWSLPPNQAAPKRSAQVDASSYEPARNADDTEASWRRFKDHKARELLGKRPEGGDSKSNKLRHNLKAHTHVSIKSAAHVHLGHSHGTEDVISGISLDGLGAPVNVDHYTHMQVGHLHPNPGVLDPGLGGLNLAIMPIDASSLSPHAIPPGLVGDGAMLGAVAVLAVEIMHTVAELTKEHPHEKDIRRRLDELRRSMASGAMMGAAGSGLAFCVHPLAPSVMFVSHGLYRELSETVARLRRKELTRDGARRASLQALGGTVAGASAGAFAVSILAGFSGVTVAAAAALCGACGNSVARSTAAMAWELAGQDGALLAAYAELGVLPGSSQWVVSQGCDDKALRQACKVATMKSGEGESNRLRVTMERIRAARRGVNIDSSCLSSFQTDLVVEVMPSPLLGARRRVNPSSCMSFQPEGSPAVVELLPSRGCQPPQVMS